MLIATSWGLLKQPDKQEMSSPRFVFEPFELDSARRRLTVSGEPVAISERQLDVLLLLVARSGQIISKDDLRLGCRSSTA